LANKAYVDSVAQGLDAKHACQAGTIGALSGFGVYSSGTKSFTETSATGALTIDTVVLATGHRLLIQDQGSAAENGIYVVSGINGTDAVVLTRADDMDIGAEIPGAYTLVQSGDVNGGNGFVVTAPVGSATIDTDAISWSQFSGAGQITAGDGLSKSGNDMSLDLKANGGLAIDAGALKIDLGATSITGQLAGSDIADDAITLEKMANLTEGTLIVGNASSNPSALARGDANTVLMSNGTAVSYSQVTSNMIQNGTIVNDDINTSAGIAISKLAARTISGKDLGTDLDALTAGTDGGISMSSYDGSAAVSNLAIDFASETGLEVAGAGDGLRLKPAIAGNGIEMAGTGQVMSLTLDGVEGTSGLEVGTEGIKISAGKVVTAMLADDAVDKAKLAADCAGDGLAQNTDGSLELDLNDLTAVAAAPADDDFLSFVDTSDTNATKKVSVLNLSKAVFANVTGGDATINADGALTIGADAVQTGMVHDDVATELAGDGLSASGGVMALDLYELTEAAVNVANDSFAFIDANDTDGSKRDTIADLVAAMAGNSTITANLGVLTAANVTIGTTAIAPGASSTTLAGVTLLTGDTDAGLSLAAGGVAQDVRLLPTTSGKVVVGTGALAATVASSGDNDLVLQTGNATTGSITIADGLNGNIDVAPNGTGKVLVGGTAPTINPSSSANSLIIGSGATASLTFAETGSGTATFAGSEVLGTEFTATSDERKKQNIVTVTNAGAKLDTIRGCTFEWKANGKQSGGCIAQDMQKIMPEVVREIEDEVTGESTLKLQYNGVIALLVEALKETRAEVRALQELISE
jgi:hypothetical protein